MKCENKKPGKKAQRKKKKLFDVMKHKSRNPFKHPVIIVNFWLIWILLGQRDKNNQVIERLMGDEQMLDLQKGKQMGMQEDL